jgi:hypothetical protein
MVNLLTRNAVYIIFLFSGLACIHYPPEKEVIKLNVPISHSPSFRNFLGINAFEWDFFKNGRVSESRVQIMQSFGEFRHYMDWERIESEKDKYTFNPTHSGGFDYDKVYQICNENKIEILSCLQNSPKWLINTYPEDQRGADNVPAFYGLNLADPKSYIDQARAAFQFAARYGNNKFIDTVLLKVDKSSRWSHDMPNTIKRGLGYVHYLECSNEMDKTWKGKKAQQSPEEYAANLSAFYDGDMGKLGKNVGVKNADPTMKVVMMGLSSPNPGFVIKMIEWCKKYRGFKPDGSVNLCFDIINYHLYNNDATTLHDVRTVGMAPELSMAGKKADEFVAMSKRYANNMDVWITESGYDINPESPQRAIKIGSKSALITQADWMLRSAFLYARHQLKKSFFYMLDDVATDDPTPYSSSGFAVDKKKRPVADYFLQTKKLLGAYGYKQTIHKDPIVDIYSTGNKYIYVLYVPDQVDRKATYELELHGYNFIKIYKLIPGKEQMRPEFIRVTNNKIKLIVTETPIFVEPIKM